MNLLGVAPAEPLAIVGHRAFCDVWAQGEEGDNRGLVLVSFLGPYTVLQSLWAQLLAGQSVELAGGIILRRQTGSTQPDEPDLTPVRYHRATTRFAEIEQAHLVLVVETATLQLAAGQTGYFLAPGPQGDPERFFDYWNRIVPLPARPAWAPYLWGEGLRKGSIRPIAAYGCQCWAIDPATELWSEIIRAGIEDEHLT